MSEAISFESRRHGWLFQHGVVSGRVQYELKGGGHYRHEASPEMKSFGLPDKVILGEVLGSDPPRKMVQTWHPQFTPEMIAEPPSRLTYEIMEGQGVCTVTITHDVTGAPMVAGMVPGGGKSKEARCDAQEEPETRQGRRQAWAQDGG